MENTHKQKKKKKKESKKEAEKDTFITSQSLRIHICFSISKILMLKGCMCLCNPEHFFEQYSLTNKQLQVFMLRARILQKCSEPIGVLLKARDHPQD